MCLKFSRDYQGAALRLFVSHRGFPGEGPRRPKLAAADRPQLDLSRRLLSCEEVAGRAKMLAEFDSWLQTSGRGNLLAVLELDGKVVSRHLQTFGQNLYEQGRSHGDFVHAILAVSDEARDLRRSLQGAWDSAATWHALLPSSNHIPTPSIVACAMIALAMCWGWRSMATFVMLVFFLDVETWRDSSASSPGSSVPGRSFVREACLVRHHHQAQDEEAGGSTGACSNF